MGHVILVGSVLDYGSGIRCMSKRLEQQIEQPFRGERLVYHA